MQDSHHWKRHTPPLLDLITRREFGVISDFDGTLSSFVGDPQAAAIDPACAAALDVLLASGVTVALVSGRAVLDLYPRFPRSGMLYFGNHGMEYWHDGEAHIAAEAAVWEAPLKQLLERFGAPPIPGVIIEDKRVTASVHYRRTADPASTRESLRTILAPLCAQFGFALSEGQFIWEIKPPILINKGTALQTIIEAADLNGVLFLGDDVTDFTAMQKLHQLTGDRVDLRGLSVGVLYPSSPPGLIECSDMITNGVRDTADLLAWVAQAVDSL